MADQTRLQKSVLFGASFLCVVSLLIVIGLVFWHFSHRNQIIDTARNLAQEKARNAAAQIEDKLGELLIAQTIADELTSGALPDDEVETRVVEDLDKNPELGAITVAFDPEFVPSSQTRYDRDLYAPYSERVKVKVEGEGEIEKVEINFIEKSYDYTLADLSVEIDGKPIRTAWYGKPLSEGAVWGEPYFGTGTQEYWAGFGAPFYRIRSSDKQRVIAGIVSADLTLAQIQRLVSSVDLGEPGVGYGIIVSQTGVLISHPIDDFVRDARLVSSVDPSLNIQGIQALANGAGQGESQPFDLVDERSGKSFWLFFAKVDSAGWWVGIVLDKEQIFNTQEIIQRRQRQVVGIAMGSLAFLFFFSVLALRAYRGTVPGIWGVSFSFSVLCIAGIAFLWVTNINTEAEADDRNISLIDQAVAAKVASDYAFATGNDPVHVPTGIFIQSIEFTSANNVTLTGYLWQKFSEDTPDSVTGVATGGTPGFILPESISISVSESYREDKGGHTLVGWNFSAVLRQNFDYSKYPFDREDVWVRIWPQDFGQGVVLTPDLISYNNNDPSNLMGLEREDFVIEGWDVASTFFSYRENSYETNFGKQSFIGQADFPDLYFNVRLKRQFVNAFISNLIPLFAVTLLLFAVLMTVRASESARQVYGIHTAAVLTFCGALFFVVILAHINLRSSLAAQGIIYLESFYFVTYLALLFVSVNSILTASPAEFWFVHFRDNFMTRILYWPLFTGLLLAITLFAFA